MARCTAQFGVIVQLRQRPPVLLVVIKAEVTVVDSAVVTAVVVTEVTPLHHLHQGVAAEV